jgi:septal ring factor EnvC (AmiA/AmiB activator)
MARVMRRLHAVAVAVLLVFALATSARVLHAATAEKDLETVKKKIAREKQGISQAQRQETSLLKSLEQIDGELDRKGAELKQAQSNLQKITGEMEAKQAEAARLEDSMENQRALLKERAIALYRWHRSGSPLMIFAGDLSMNRILQRKRYLETALRYDRELVAQLTEEAEAQEALRHELAEKKRALDSQRNKLSAAREAVRREGDKKKLLLVSVQREKESRTQALRELEQAAARLQRMIEELARRAARKPPATPPGVGLGKLYGKLDWPVRGELLSGFGKTRHREFGDEVFRNGIDIGVATGEEVKAVEKGTVAFADRFAGYGRMVIVDHGERYYTVYAHLSELLKKSGDKVQRGETLGLAGDSDSLAGSKLYFELRKDGRSVDPVPWFKK